jgi:hypothetical protein
LVQAFLKKWWVESDFKAHIAEMERWKMFCAGLQKQDSNQFLEEAIELADPS